MHTQKEFIESMPPEMIQEIVEAGAYYANEYNKASNKLDALKELYRITDELFNEIPDRRDIKCKKGCAYCCHIRIEATPIEAKLAASYAKENNIPIDKNRLEHQQDLDVQEYMFSPHKRCVFLGDDNTCQIYEVRPFSCRNYYVITEPELCNVDKYPHGQVTTVNDIQSQTPTLGAMMAEGTHGNFAKLLLKEL